ncbi:MAG: hypothetical protein BRC41_18815 [Cyanobacteria bacterium QH_9_48_43]|nr:MAG: hypothetical protein BRC35_00560 [Cyanobacteria bacterium QH_10_48_56]PSO65391.1 MAG: hypothetical protein BRC36_03920 [Cyanobacteria bacterium QH_2_48_84]PSO69838.1 MAG: hypothetical protein BRC37_16770 [Cyanobacteria bacterium QH_3_48_40]PSO79532.1 MAG: hypothetical protein BRC41_18815 [Cyanobacteria bacterium QH_9_48_43]PSO83437.1 MAG: hypothetical protein BRC45_07835 [Cyanobacteria bacterium QS_5_48_63]PSO89742.1 MAG: hypothetical protein BRC43_03885 [Cyanobacteria bacterium QS_3_4
MDVEMTKVLTRAQLEEINAESLQIDELHYNADGFDRIESVAIHLVAIIIEACNCDQDSTSKFLK